MHAEALTILNSEHPALKPKLGTLNPKPLNSKSEARNPKPEKPTATRGSLTINPQ